MTARDLVTVGGQRLHVVSAGTGAPVVLTSGLGGAWFDWLPTVDRLRRGYRVIVFDRPGLGGSHDRREWAGRTLRQEADLLAGLARWAGGPVVVVAHSLAGLHAEAFARLRPELVRGLVLVDPSAPVRRPAFAEAFARLSPLARLAGSVAGATGLARLAGPGVRGMVMRRICERGEVASPENVREVYAHGHVLGALLAEDLGYRRLVADLLTVRSHRPFPAVPLRVITALRSVRNPDGRRRAHAELAALSPDGRQVVLPDVGHVVHIDRPEAVADAVAGL